MAANKLRAPSNIIIDFAPSPKQYELWKLLQPDYCPLCEGNIEPKLVGYDAQMNPQYKPTCCDCGNTDLPQLILGGGAAGGGKSYLGSVWLVSSCIRFADIRAVVARKTLKSLKESTFNTIKTVMKDWGLKEDENYTINNVEGTITFWNDSVIILKEMVDLPSDPEFERFGSSEYTIAMVDEVSEISEKAVEVLFSRLRWRTHETFKTPRMFMSTNPTINWVRSRFVQDDNGDPVQCRDGEAYVPFSVFDNPDIKFRQTYEASLNKIRDKATKERLLYGNWDFVTSNDAALYKGFSGDKHLVTNLRESKYDPDKPLILSYDFNVFPFMTCLAIQIDYAAKEVYFLEEILGKPEDKTNNTPKLGNIVRDKLYKLRHVGGVVITGDPAGAARSTQTEDGVNNFTILATSLGNGILKPTIKLLRKQPPQVTRVDWINEVLADNLDGWKVFIDLRCRKLTEDLIYQTSNEDGTKNKSKITDPKTGVKHEKYGHCSDAFDYFMCFFLRESWYKYERGGRTDHQLATTTINPKFDY
ncbi:MAG: phage terminase large subunit [Bacteroidales bacterium]